MLRQRAARRNAATAKEQAKFIFVVASSGAEAQCGMAVQASFRALRMRAAGGGKVICAAQTRDSGKDWARIAAAALYSKRSMCFLTLAMTASISGP